MLILIGRILLAVAFGAGAVGITCYVVAKIRERTLGDKIINKQIEKQQKKAEKEAQQEAQKEKEAEQVIASDKIANTQATVDITNKKNIIEYGNGAFRFSDSAWKTYITKLIVGGHIEETKNAEVLSILNVSGADRSEKLKFVGDIRDINDICTTNGNVNNGIKAPFEVNDTAVIAEANGTIKERFVYNNNGLVKLEQKSFEKALNQEIIEK